MILVLLGTQNNDFHRLLSEVERNIEIGNINEDVVVQAGFTKYYSDKMRIFSLISKDKLEHLVDEADLIITHAGIGSIEMSLQRGKKVIAVPRKKIYGEHVNNHQEDIEKKFDNNGFLIGIDDVSDLGDALNKAKFFVPSKYTGFDNFEIVNVVRTFIDRCY